MATFRYSLHADIAIGRNLGLLVWNDSRAVYYGSTGCELRANEINEAIRRAVSDGKLDELVECYLEHGGGGYQSFSVQETSSQTPSWTRPGRSQQRRGASSPFHQESDRAAPAAAKETISTSSPCECSGRKSQAACSSTAPGAGKRILACSM
jgi:hypothetical protein